MKIAFIIIAFLCCGSLWAQDTIRSYFFKGVDLSAPGTEVVLIVKDPQTKIAEEINGKIFSDPKDLSFFQNEFYSTTICKIIDSTGLRECREVRDVCGHDLYFYLRKEGELKTYYALNSLCGIGKSNLEFLANRGKKHHVDTFYTYFPKGVRNKKQFRKLFDDAVYSELRGEARESVFYERVSRSIAYIPFYYDGSVTFSVPFDTILGPERQIEKILAEMSVESNSKSLNWSVNQEFCWRYELHEPGVSYPENLDFTFWFTEDLSPHFKDLPTFKILSSPKKRHSLGESSLFIWSEK